MVRSLITLVGALMMGAVLAIPAFAASQVYEYRIKHPLYGDIGTYTNVVQHAGDDVHVETKISVAVKVLGQVVYWRESEHAEYWRGERLHAFRNITVTNGDRMEVRGEARDNSFVIATAA